MASRIAILALAIPVAAFALLIAVPSLDEQWGSSLFHFRVVSAASLLAASACFVLIASARVHAVLHPGDARAGGDPARAGDRDADGLHDDGGAGVAGGG